MNISIFFFPPNFGGLFVLMCLQGSNFFKKGEDIFNS